MAQVDWPTRWYRTPEQKALFLQQAEEIRDNCRRSHEAVVLVNGCFGMLHPGHANLLNRAARLGMCLMVAINTDESYEFVKQRKPKIKWADRAYLVASLQCVDYVLPLEQPTPHAMLDVLRPDFLCKCETSEMPPAGHEVVAEYGGRVVVFPAEMPYSTSKLLGA